MIGPLVQEATNGERDAVNRLILTHQARLLRFVSRRVPNSEDRFDICQEAWLRAFARLQTFEWRSSFETWLFSIAKHLIGEHHRRQARSGAQPNHGDKRHIAECYVDSQVSRQDMMERLFDVRQQLDHCLTCIIDALSLEEQLAIMLRDVCGYPNSEAATLMENNLGRFKHLLHCARQRLDRLSRNSCALARKTGQLSSSCAGFAHWLHLSIPSFSGYPSGASDAVDPEVENERLLSLRRRLVQDIRGLASPPPDVP
jgi:RNA polymerase sigma-70 factor (ECF subfamily)